MIHILHLEDDPVDSQLAADLLREEGLEAELERVHTLEAFRQALARQPHDLILSDYSLPGMNALQALATAHEDHPEVPFIFFSGTIGEELAIETLKRGAIDYVLKDHPSRLAPTIRRALHEAQEQSLRKQGEAALARTTARLDGIISSAMDAIISIDEQQRIVLFNPAAEKMFGLPAAEALGQSINRLIPERFRATHTRHVEEFGQTGISNRAMGHLGALSGLRANGEEFPIEASISQTLVRGEKLFTVILRDITQRQRADDALRQARDELARTNADLERKVQERTAQLLEANANLQTFAYSAAHDLRSPLRSIHNFSSMLLQDFGPGLGPEGQMLLERVSSSALQMNRLVNDLLEYTKVSAAELPLQPLNLRQVVDEALSLVDGEVDAKQAAVTVLEPLPDVLGHHATVVLLLNNLLSNALKFLPPQVQPHIRVWAEEVRSGECGVRNEESQGRESDSAPGPRPQALVRLWVEDNGIGIDPKDAGKLFGAFQRLNSKQAYPGTGLGLAIVKKAAERLGGAVGLESQPGQGSRFWVELPRAC